MTNYRTLANLTPCLVLLGNSGVGKDTLATELVKKYGYTRYSFGDFLREDVLKTYGEPQSRDERSKDCYPGFVHGDSSIGASTKDLMLIFGQVVALSDPLRYSSMLQDSLNSRGSKSPVVVTDCRKPIELDMLQNMPGLAVWIVRIESDCRGEKRRLDGLLGGWADGIICNDSGTTVPQMAEQLAKIIERTTPSY